MGLILIASFTDYDWTCGDLIIVLADHTTIERERICKEKIERYWQNILRDGDKPVTCFYVTLSLSFVFVDESNTSKYEIRIASFRANSPNS